MIARLTRTLLLIQFAIALAIAAVGVMLFRAPVYSAAAMGISIVFLFRMLITANNFWLSWYFGSTTPSEYRIGVWQAVRLFFGEFRSTMMASSWTMPFRTFSRYTVNGGETLPVLLVHGYGCNSGYWHAMSKVLAHARITHHAVDLEPVAGSIDAYVPLIHEAVERLCREQGTETVVIVAHSMGGLATRAYLRDHGSRRVAKAITLGTPHRGTALARFGIGHNTRQMLWSVGEQEGLSSEWLRELAARENKSTYRLFVSIYSHHDNIIAPQTSSHLLGARNSAHAGIGHVELAFHSVIQAEVIDEIRNASRHVDSFAGANR
jgi:triacylglycerol esterase/lipase EstA (alpha/beta hydrolase family)